MAKDSLTIQVVVNSEQLRFIKDRADKLQRSLSHTVMLMIQDYISKQDNDTEK